DRSVACRTFFFSSRRRHTRSKRDWSSDVCSSDLGDRRSRFAGDLFGCVPGFVKGIEERAVLRFRIGGYVDEVAEEDDLVDLGERSEERRVGKECGYRWSGGDGRKKKGVTAESSGW